MLTATAMTAEGAAFWNGLTLELQQVAALARHAGAALGCRAIGGAAHWLTVPPPCACALTANDGIAGTPGRACERIEVACDGARLGVVLVCCEQDAEGLSAAIREAVRAAARRVELERGEEALLHELSTAWESLEAVSEVSAGMRSLEDTGALLERIMARAVGQQEGVQAVLWLLRDGRLEPAAQRSRHVCVPRDPDKGLIGRTLQGHAGVILNDPERIALVPDLEPELRQARGVVVAPVTTRQGLLGALVIWREDGSGAFDSRNMHLTETLALQAAMVAENDRLHRAALENERLRQEVEIGFVIQQTLLLGQPPTGLRSLRLVALTVPSALVDGDFYDFFRHDHDTLDVMVGDVMGKGVPAALVGAATKNQLLRALSHLLGSGQRPPAVDTIVAEAHRAMVPQLIRLERFVTLCYARFEAARRRVTLVDCGHTRTVHYRSQTHTVGLLQGQDSPLGFLGDSDYQPVQAPFDAGDVFFFYSDGLTETRNADGEMFGEERLVEAVRAHGGLPPEALVERLRQIVVEFSATGAFADDLTCVVVQIAPPRWRDSRVYDSDLTCLEPLRIFLTETVADQLPAGSLHPEALGCFILAINEAASNIIRHAYGRETGHPIEVGVDVFDDRIEVLLRHRGRSFAPAAEQVAAPSAPREGGLGLFIIRQFTSEADYGVDALGYAYTRLVKRLDLPKQ